MFKYFYLFSLPVFFLSSHPITNHLERVFYNELSTYCIDQALDQVKKINQEIAITNNDRGFLLQLICWMQYHHNCRDGKTSEQKEIEFTTNCAVEFINLTTLDLDNIQLATSSTSSLHPTPITIAPNNKILLTVPSKCEISSDPLKSYSQKLELLEMALSIADQRCHEALEEHQLIQASLQKHITNTLAQLSHNRSDPTFFTHFHTEYSQHLESPTPTANNRINQALLDQYTADHLHFQELAEEFLQEISKGKHKDVIEFFRATFKQRLSQELQTTNTINETPHRKTLLKRVIQHL